ncbi:triose-phosphate isomerase [Candidatus Adlerbacteria bacterium RIFOXYC1_FULL_48_26]|uniref:Triosephosphate isomerase n=1 Tax=Candidatus Adlerbacteria bacterium RIFOXYC1_FULL_48_26 TaxID=1797247 RepID=A0A1F4Y4H0_9BACT|nr:MAG: triose-phosphate isomerase [Candidatus Adlerbacteria bacterium RIFOXYC1_FULL_48_26]
MKKILIAGNWKLYVTEVEDAKNLASQLKRKISKITNIDTVLMPTAPLISTVSAAVKKSSIAVGAQTVSPFLDGAHTGYESAAALKSAGVKWALVGHSERRAQESEDVIQAQVQAAVKAGLSVMLCVGEAERDPQGAHFSLIERQLSSALAHFPAKGTKLVIAYEPVWAIGKSAAEACKPADLEEMSIFIRRALTELFDRTAATKIPILYGGSVDGSNVHELLTQGGVSGFLVGRASANAKSLFEIIDACKA